MVERMMLQLLRSLLGEPEQPRHMLVGVEADRVWCRDYELAQTIQHPHFFADQTVAVSSTVDPLVHPYLEFPDLTQLLVRAHSYVWH